MKRLLLAAFLLGNVAIVSADERKGFFEQDFAKSPLDEKSGGSGELKGDVMPSPKRTSIPSSIRAEDTGNLFDNATPTPLVPTPLPTTNEGVHTAVGSVVQDSQVGGLPSYRVGAILSGMQKSHLKSNLDELIDFSERSKLPVGDVYVLGKPGDTYGMINEILTDGWRGVRYFRIANQVKAVTELPEQYSEVKMSPTWVVETSKGEVLLEAIQPLAAQFTKDNKLNER